MPTSGPTHRLCSISICNDLQRLDDGGTTAADLPLPTRDTDRDGATKASTDEIPKKRVERKVAARILTWSGMM